MTGEVWEVMGTVPAAHLPFDPPFECVLHAAWISSRGRLRTGVTPGYARHGLLPSPLMARCTGCTRVLVAPACPLHSPCF